jgi:hypothetical protein
MSILLLGQPVVGTGGLLYPCDCYCCRGYTLEVDLEKRVKMSAQSGANWFLFTSEKAQMPNHVQ